MGSSIVVISGQDDRCRESGRGKSELHRAGELLTATRGDPRESGTENKPPMGGNTTGKGEKVEGKSPPRNW